MRAILLKPVYSDMDTEIIGSDVNDSKDWFWDDICCTMEEQDENWKDKINEDDRLPKEGNKKLQDIYDDLYQCESLSDLEDFMGKHRHKYGSDSWRELQECDY